MAYKSPLEQFPDLLKDATTARTHRPSFKLDKKLYPDVEETPYGFIYNVNGHSITDQTAQRMTWGDKFAPKENDDFGFTVDIGGDESYYPTFDEAYKAAKGIK